MKYLKVLWNHNFEDEPVVLYSELSENRWEIRKIEIFPNGSSGYAYDNNAYGTTHLSEKPLPSVQDIASDPQFNPYEISKGEFEKVWNKISAT